jgi:hypothetical protein
MLAKQESLLGQIAEPRDDLPVWLASARGMIALIENNAKGAAEQFEMALEKARTLPDFDESARLTLQQRLAFASIRLGEGARAEKLFRELIAAYSLISGPDSPSVLRVRLNLAQAFMIQNKHAEAILEANSIYPAFVAALGEEHELTMQLLTTRAQSAGSIEMWDDAIRDGLTIHQIALRKQGPHSFFAVATLSDAALAQCRSGRLAEGEANARKAFDSSSKAFGPRAGLTGGTAYTLASCLIDLNRMPEAGKLLREIDVPVVAQLAGFPDWGANVDLALAEIAYRSGDVVQAEKHLQVAAPAFTRENAEPYQKRKLEALRAALAPSPQPR